MDEKAQRLSMELDLLDELADQIFELQEPYRKDYEAEDAFAIGTVQGIEKAHALVKQRSNLLRDELFKLIAG